jgi:hypothetical protein
MITKKESPCSSLTLVMGARPSHGCVGPHGTSLTIRGAAAGPITRAVAHFDPLPPHFQQIWIGQAGFARVSESLLIVAPVVRDVDRSPGSPGCGLLQLRTRIGVTRLILLGEKTHRCLTLWCKQSHRRSASFL